MNNLPAYSKNRSFDAKKNRECASLQDRQENACQCRTTIGSPIRRYLAGKLGLSLFFLILFPGKIGDQIAHAETIWVESETSLLIQTDGFEGGRLRANLVDDLNHGVGNADLFVFLRNRASGEELEFQYKTDASGELVTSFMLPDGGYEGHVVFRGTGPYRGTIQTIQFETMRCRLNSEIHPEGTVLWPKNEPLSFELWRSGCLDMAADAIVSAGPESIRVHINEGEVSTSAAFESPFPEAGDLTLESSLLEEYKFEPERHRTNIIVYDDLFKPDIEVRSHWNGFFLNADLRYAAAGIRAKLEIERENAETIELFAQSDAEGHVLFADDNNLTGCFRYTIRRDDMWPEYAALTGNYCIDPVYHRTFWPIAVLGIVGLVGAGGWRFAKRRKYPRPPKPGKQGVYVSSKTLDRSLASQKGTSNGELVCIDLKTSSELPLSETKIEINGEPSHVSQWPCEFSGNCKFRVQHPDYILWQGRLKSGRHHVIGMLRRRDYIIQCYESVYEKVSGRSLAWGHKTPFQLRDSESTYHLSKTDYERLKKFCDLVNQAAFDSDHIGDEQLDQIYALMKKL